MAADRYSRVEAWLRSLPASQQTDVAITLARLVEPFAALSKQGQPEGGLADVAQMVRAADSLVEIDHARHLLLSTPELALEEEPEGLAWFSFRATAAWVYAADSRATAPSDGAVNALKLVLDLLDYADDSLGDTNLTGHFLEWADHRMQYRGACLEALNLEVMQAVRQLSGAA